MNVDWLASPVWLIVNALVAYRLARLAIDDDLPPLPRLRQAVVAWVTGRASAKLYAARQADEKDPEVQAKQAESDQLARRGGYNSSRVVGPRERAVRDRMQPSGVPALVDLISCYWCLGYWISLAVAVAASLIPAFAWSLIAAPFALSALVGLISSRTD